MAPCPLCRPPPSGAGPLSDILRDFLAAPRGEGQGEQQIHEAIERVAALREHDWQAFYYGRDRLLSLLPIKLELPKTVSAEPCAAAVG